MNLWKNYWELFAKFHPPPPPKKSLNSLPKTPLQDNSIETIRNKNSHLKSEVIKKNSLQKIPLNKEQKSPLSYRFFQEALHARAFSDLDYDVAEEIDFSSYQNFQEMTVNFCGGCGYL